MKRILAVILALLTALSLVSCGASRPADDASGDASAPLEITDAEVAYGKEEDASGEDAAAQSPDTGETEVSADEGGYSYVPGDEGGGSYSYTPDTDYSSDTASTDLEEDGVYTSAEDVALYIHTYSHLPDNFITKDEARQLGWSGGSLEPYAPGMCIGGDYFGNYEGLLPVAAGRTYTECDINTLGARSRGAERIIYSNDGLIYYTDDHYESFTLLYED
ncbi:MAG: ribonuclease [Oscillospiraceae bacterium]|nr:ribonuclease [Oscillospiraceae bacterium]